MSFVLTTEGVTRSMVCGSRRYAGKKGKALGQRRNIFFLSVLVSAMIPRLLLFLSMASHPTKLGIWFLYSHFSQLLFVLLSEENIRKSYSFLGAPCVAGLLVGSSPLTYMSPFLFAFVHPLCSILSAAHHFPNPRNFFQVGEQGQEFKHGPCALDKTKERKTFES